MKKILIVIVVFVTLVCSFDYFFEKEKREKIEKLDTIISITYDTITNKRDSINYVVNYYGDTIDWWGYINKQKASKKHMDSVKRRIDSLAFLFGYTPYIGYTFFNSVH